MPAPYDYSSSSGYTRARSDWTDFPSTSTPIQQTHLDKVEQALFDKKNELFNVRDFGALGDNSTNDAAAIGNAISAANTVGGGIVFFPKGIYRVGSALSVPNFVSFMGVGEGSIIRATGNFYVFNLNPAHRSHFEHLQVDAVSAQSSGGAFDFTNGGSNIRVDSVYIGSNIHTSFNVAPIAAANTVLIRRIRWNGTTGHNTGFKIGGGGALITDVYISDCVGTASTTSDMVNWIVVPANADTVKVSGSTFYRCSGDGFNFGGTSLVTNIKLVNCTIDSALGNGIEAASVRELACTGCEVSTCGAANVPGVNVSANSKGFRFVNGVVQNCAGYGAIIFSGALQTIFSNSLIVDNNTSNTAANDGIAVAANTSRFQIVNNVLGNGLYLSGFQKTGISVAAGTSNDYVITGNRCQGNATTDVVDDQGTGTNKYVANNTPAFIPTIASAASIAAPSYAEAVSVSGTTTITSVTASWVGRKVTLIFSGALTFTDGSNLKLAGNFVTTADDTITLVCDGTNWIEVSRSTN